MQILLRDLRYALRMLRRSPGFTTVAVLTLALGIGANTSIFSVINAALLRTLPVRDPQQLAIVGDPARVHSYTTGSPRTDLLSEPLYQELARTQDAFDGLAATGYFGPDPEVLLDEHEQTGTPARAAARIVSGNFFSVLGVDAFMGRTFRAEDEKAPGSDPVTVISYKLWERRFNRDPGVIGRTIRVNGYPLTVIGVMPQGFTGEVVGDAQDLWVPLMMQPQVMPAENRLNNVQDAWLVLIGRLKSGLNIEQAQARMQVTYQRMASSSFASRFDSDNAPVLLKQKLQVVSGARGLSRFRYDFSRPLVLLMAIVAVVLLIASVNLANLLLARSAARRKEIAVRLAIGASNARIMRQVLTECVLLAFLGGAVGLFLAQLGTRALLAIVRVGTAVPLDTTPDPLVLGFTALVCIVTGLLFGLVPSLRSRKVELLPALSSASRGEEGSAGSRWSIGRILVAAQVALSILVLFAGTLLVHSLQKLHAVDTGYRRDNLLLARVDPRVAGYKAANYMAFCQDLLGRLRQLPEVTSVTYSSNGLFSGSESADAITVPGFQPPANDNKSPYNDTVGPGYFTALGIPILMGRDIAQQDLGETPKVAVINESMAHYYFGSQNPIGRTFTIKDAQTGGVPLEIVGVTRDVRDHDLRRPLDRRFYMPLNLFFPYVAMNFEIRTTGDPRAVGQSIRNAVHEANPALQVLDLDTVNVLIDDRLSAEILVARLSSFFAGLVLLLASIGLYGVTSYAVAGRTREIGVRMALGAQARDVCWLVLREALVLVAAGIVVGIPLAMASSRLLGSMLFEVHAADPGAIFTSLFVLSSVALLAAFIPARRATRVDP
ncbi:MAG TPA: ABC transporter permease, partial [Terriglobales bacterium]